MDMPKKFYEITKLGHTSTEREGKLRAISELKDMIANGNFGVYKEKAIRDKIQLFTDEANKMLADRILDQRIFNPRFIRSTLSSASLECKLLEELIETNETYELIGYMLKNDGKELYPSLDLKNVTYLKRKDGKMVFEKGMK